MFIYTKKLNLYKTIPSIFINHAIIKFQSEMRSFGGLMKYVMGINVHVIKTNFKTSTCFYNNQELRKK